MSRRLTFGRWGGPIELFDIFEDWRDERARLIEAGVNPSTGEAFGPHVLEALQTGNMRLLEASPDTKADFSTFLWEPIQANFYRGYSYVESEWKKFLGHESLNSFDEVRIKGVNGLTGIGLVGDLGEYPGMRRTVRPEAAIVLETYGAVYAQTRKLLRSKGAEVLTRDIPEQMGQAFADFITRLFIAMVVANPNAPDGVAMYHSSRGNTTTAALSEDSVVDAAVWLRTRVDPDNRPIATNIRSVIVQNDRQALRLRQIMNSQLTGIVNNDIATTAMGRGNMNPIAGSDLIPSDGVSINPWFPDANDVYYFGDPDRNPAFVAAFLDGQEKPMIGMADATVMHLSNSNGSGHDPYSYEGDSIDYKGRHDVGVSAVEPLSTYRQTPA
jgi:hypothetical protein